MWLFGSFQLLLRYRLLQQESNRNFQLPAHLFLQSQHHCLSQSFGLHTNITELNKRLCFSHFANTTLKSRFVTPLFLHPPRGSLVHRVSPRTRSNLFLPWLFHTYWLTIPTGKCFICERSWRCSLFDSITSTFPRQWDGDGSSTRHCASYGFPGQFSTLVAR